MPRRILSILLCLGVIASALYVASILYEGYNNGGTIKVFYIVGTVLWGFFGVYMLLEELGLIRSEKDRQEKAR